jgi:hypothetical protein
MYFAALRFRGGLGEKLLTAKFAKKSREGRKEDHKKASK